MHENTSQRTYYLFDRHIHRVGDLLKYVKIPGFRGIPLYNVLWFLIRRLQNGSLNIRASSIAFNFLLAIGPGVVFLLTLIPFFPVKYSQQDLLEILNQIMPSNSYIVIKSLLNELYQQHGSLPLFGLVVSLFFAQKGIHGIIESFNANYQTIEVKPWFHQRIVSIILVFIFYIIIIIAAFLMFFNKNIIQELVQMEIIQRDLTYYSILTGRWIILVAFTFFSISFLYYLAPRPRTKWKFFSVGSVFATILAIAASLGFSYFVNHFAPLNRFFGSIGALIALMLWIYFNSINLLIGFELNVSIRNANQQKAEQ